MYNLMCETRASQTVWANGHDEFSVSLNLDHITSLKFLMDNVGLL